MSEVIKNTLSLDAVVIFHLKTKGGSCENHSGTLGLGQPSTT